MQRFLLFLPLIFIFHDMEEILGFGWFFRNNPWLYERFPKVMKHYIGFTEFGMALGVYEELMVFGGVSLLSYCFPNKLFYSIWFGFFMALAAHFVVHIGHTLYIRKYIPSFITSVISLPASIYIMIKASYFYTFDFYTVIGIISGIIIQILNLMMLHMVMHRVNEKINDPKECYNMVLIPGRVRQ